MDDFEGSAAFSPRDKLALRLVASLTSTPAAVSDELFAELRQQFDHKQLVELASAIAWENYLARSNRMFAIGSDDFSHGQYCPLPVGR